MISWNDALEFCRRVTEQECVVGRLPDGYVYRLPTDAEWEFSYRATSKTPFPFGQTVGPAKWNFKGRYPRELADRVRDADGIEPSPEPYGLGRSRGEIYGTVSVGAYEPNAWGIYNLHGNVREWCLDRFNSRYRGGSQVDYAGPDSGPDRVACGGGWENCVNECRTASRDHVNPSMRSNSRGFRIVLVSVVP